jgi:hypothetical protein
MRFCDASDKGTASDFVQIRKNVIETLAMIRQAFGEGSMSHVWKVQIHRTRKKAKQIKNKVKSMLIIFCNNKGINLLCSTLYTGHHLWNQKELLAVGVYLASISSQYVWNGMQMRGVLCPVHHLLNLQYLLYNSRDQYLRGTLHRLQYI